MPKGVYIRTKEYKEKISKSLMGRKLSEEHKQNIRKNQPHLFGKENPFYGKTHSTKNKKLWSESKKGDKTHFMEKNINQKPLKNSERLG
jgi:hypothetical protein